MADNLAGAPTFAADSRETVDRVALDGVLERLTARKDAWASSSCQERLDLLAALRDSLTRVAASWVALCCEHKRVALESGPGGEEWLSGPSAVARNIRLLEQSLRDLKHQRAPQLPGKPTANRHDQVVVPVFPTGVFDRLLFPGTRAEVWLDPEQTLTQFRARTSAPYEEPDRCAGVELVLGAGNVSSIGPMDALSKAFIKGHVVLLKMNPVNDYLTEVFEAAFAPLITADVLAVVRGGAEVGQYLCHHALVDAVHITGSDKTHDAIVFGSAASDKQQPRLTKPITSELGNVSPILIVPDRWSPRQLRYQAEHVATMLANNAGFNCVSARVLVTHAAWPQREAFLRAVEHVLSQLPSRHAYYPGAQDRFARFMEGRDRHGGNTKDGHLPWTMIRNLDGDAEDEICFRSEAFCSVMGEVAIPADSAGQFLDRAVDFANERLWGTLAANLLVAPRSRRRAEVADALERAIATLRYGTVSINHWAGVGYGMVSPPWGAFPGHSLEDIQSGQGVVHNTYLLERPQKTVVQGPFVAFPKPAWFVTHRNLAKIGPALFRFETQPAWTRLPQVVRFALG